MPTHLRTKDAAAYLGVRAQTLQNWRRKGIGPTYRRIGPKLYLYQPSDLDAWMAQEAQVIPQAMRLLESMRALEAAMCGGGNTMPWNAVEQVASGRQEA